MKKIYLKYIAFAVVITVVLLMALTTNFVSAGPPVKVRVTPGDQEEELNPSEPCKVNLDPSDPIAFPDKRAVHELIYDDGVAEGAYYMYDAYNGFAVRFTPPSYPVDIITAKFCFLPDRTHEEFAVYVYDDNGPDGKPGTILGGPIYHTASDLGWCDVDLFGLGISITSGDFYILYQQLVDGPYCEALCYDETPPISGRSWDYIDDGWYIIDPKDDYMIRCVVNDSTLDSSWTFMVYLDGDNNLESAALDDFMEISSVGSTAGVNIVAQFDRIPGYVSSYDDWTTCKRFLITPGMTPTAANAIADLGECNMGDPNTLTEFVEWSMTEYPADNYALILWNHGSGWKAWTPWDAVVGRGVCWDDTNGGDHLTLQETEQALSGKYVDLLGYDACLMHMVEVVYQVKANVGISVGSEDSEPNDGWPYDTILADLTRTPTMTPRTLGAVIVQRYIDFYGSAGSETQSAVDNGDFYGLVTAIDNLAQALIAEINAGHLTQVQQARIATVEIQYDYYIDLYNFAQRIQTYVPGATSEAQTVMDNLSITVYEEAHGSLVPNEHGLSIYFPLGEEDYLATYDTTAFAIDTHWADFLKQYYAPSICGNMTVDPKSWNPTLFHGSTNSKTVTVSASDGTVEDVTVSKLSGPTWLSVNATDFGDIASGSYKTFSMTTAPPSGTSGDFTYTVRVSNTCGSPSTMNVSGTIKVLCEGWSVQLDVKLTRNSGTGVVAVGTDVAEFGVNEAATDGFDEWFDIPEPPPPPDPPYLQAYFYYPDNPFQQVKKLSTSYISDHFVGSVIWNSWPFQLDYHADDADNVTITWNPGDIAAVPTNYSLLFVVNGKLINMRSTPSYTFDVSATTTGTCEYEIIATTAGQYTFELSAGWNMISFPIEPLDRNASSIFGPDYYYLCTWNPVNRSYAEVDEIGVCPIMPKANSRYCDNLTNLGYWILVLEYRDVTVLGTRIYEYGEDLTDGWNLIGSIWTTTNVPDGTETDPADQMYPHLYTWGGDHYELTQDIEPGVGYWALTFCNCELHVFPIQRQPQAPFQQSRQIQRDLNDWLAIIEDNAEFGQKDAATDGIDTQLGVPEPPPPPAP
jgi:hypothetical protein